MKIIIYQTLPRLFGNRHPNPVANGGIAENGCGKLSDYTPAVLDEIRQLGCNYIWYTGLLEHATQTDYSAFGIHGDHPAIVKGKAGSPYAIKDYYDICPDLADDVPQRMKEFEDLVTRTHRAGLKVIIDFVPNHVARNYHSDVATVEDFGASDNTHTTFARDNNFYYLPGQDLSFDGYHESPAKATGNDCFSASPSRNDWYETVKLNYGVDYLNGRETHFSPIPQTWQKMLDILLFWAKKNIDGFRCDMAEMTPVEFWAWAIPKVKAACPQVIFIAEVYQPAEYRNYLHIGRFDYLYDKVGLYDTLRNVIVGRQPAADITHCWQAIGDIQPQMLNFLENHDEQRIASDFFAADPRRALPALVVAATMNVNPFMLYFGQELGERGMDAEGFSGRDGRTTIFDYWSLPVLRQAPDSEQQALRRYYARLLQLCNQNKAIAEGKFFDLMYVNPQLAAGQYAFLRGKGKEVLLIVANFDDRVVACDVQIPDAAWKYFGVKARKAAYSIEISGRGAFLAILNSDSSKLTNLLTIA